MLNPKDLKPGSEHYEEYCSTVTKQCHIQYDYRHTDGELFSCVADTLQECRQRRNQWLKEKTNDY